MHVDAQPKVVRLPNSCTAQAMCMDFFGELLSIDMTPLAQHFIFDFNTLRFIKPSGVTALANVTELLIKSGCTVQYRINEAEHYNSKNPLCFLDDCGFFERYLNKKVHSCSSCRGTTLPLKSVLHASYNGWIDSEVLPWLDGRLSINTAVQLPEFKVCLDEIFNNIRDHSGREIGNVFMQHYPNLNIVEIAISDFGIGIPHNVRKVHDAISDMDAITAAIIEGFSTKSSPRNRGSGLDTLIQNVAMNNGGDVTIYSYQGCLKCSNELGSMAARPSEIPFYPGTLINIKLRTDTIRSLEDAAGEDFIW